MSRDPEELRVESAPEVEELERIRLSNLERLQQDMDVRSAAELAAWRRSIRLDPVFSREHELPQEDMDGHAAAQLRRDNWERLKSFTAEDKQALDYNE